MKKILGIVLIAMIGGFTALSINYFFSKDKKQIQYVQQKQKIPVYKFANNKSKAINTDFTLAAQQSLDAVVHVKVVMNGNNRQATTYDYFFGNPYNKNSRPMEASGSGVIISNDGYIVTNNHVIKDASSIEIILNDKRSYSAKLIGRDPATDIALLKINEEKLPTIPFGNSDIIKVGEWVLAVGNPFNLTSTVTAGIISAKGRSIQLLQGNNAIESFIQTDAAVNPGNSGGALVNTQGELIGINTAIASRTGSYAGYSFAVPTSIVKKVVADLKEFGTVQRALLGVGINDIDAKLAKKLEIDKPEGVYVNTVNDGGAAKDAGIESEDIIIKINDVLVNKVSELQEQISKHRPGDKVKVAVKRGNKIKEFVVVLKNSLGTTGFVNKEVVEVLGASFEKVSKKELLNLKIPNGIKVSELGAGKLLSAGVKEGFIIVKINRNFVSSVSEIQEILNKARGGIYIEGIYPDGSTAYYAFGIE